RPFARDVGALVPEGFAAYARVLHPAALVRANDEREVRWREIARANRRVYHPVMQFGNIAGTWRAEDPHTANWSSPPRPGTLTITAARALARIAASHTTSTRCWFAVWEGWGCVGRPIDAKFELPGRAYYLAEGSVEDAARTVCEDNFWYQSPSIWWPDDRAWIIATEIDLDSTYVGGTSAAIDALLADPAIEVVPAHVSDGITAAADTINPAPAPPHR